MMKLGFRVAGCVGEKFFFHLCVSIFWISTLVIFFLYLLDGSRKYRPLLMISAGEGKG
jgi:hypothetical protein